MPSSLTLVDRLDYPGAGSGFPCRAPGAIPGSSCRWRVHPASDTPDGIREASLERRAHESTAHGYDHERAGPPVKRTVKLRCIRCGTQGSNVTRGADTNPRCPSCTRRHVSEMAAAARARPVHTGKEAPTAPERTQTPAELATATYSHGTNRGYTTGCRCTQCSVAHAGYTQRRAARHAADMARRRAS